MKVWILLLIFALVQAKHEKYSGWKSYHIGVAETAQYNALKNLEEKYQLDILDRPILGREGLVLVNPVNHDIFIKAMEDLGITHRVHINDIRRQLEREDKVLKSHKTNATKYYSGPDLPYDSYQDVETINDYIEYIGQTYPNITTVIEAGESFEGHPIKYLKISTTNFTDLSKPIIFIDAGVHSREWITIPVATWFIHKLVEDVTETDLQENFDWIILPLVNPDGYEHSYRIDRFWRKTRSTDQHSMSKVCPGVDINRNYEFLWNTCGTSNNPCSEIYCGKTPCSEVETRVVRDILVKNADRMAMYINIHSFGSLLLYSWCDGSYPSKYAAELEKIASAMASEIDSHALPGFPEYSVGNAASVLSYVTSGTSIDYAHSLGIPLCYAWELPGPINAFILEPELIGQICNESWAGMIVGARKAKKFFDDKNYYKNRK